MHVFMWKELRYFSVAYLIKQCHCWTVFSTLLYHGSISLLVLPENGQCIYERIQSFDFCFVCGLSAEISMKNTAFSVWHSHSKTCPRPRVQGTAFFKQLTFAYHNLPFIQDFIVSFIEKWLDFFLGLLMFTLFSHSFIYLHVLSYVLVCCVFRKQYLTVILMLPNSLHQCSLILYFSDQLWNSIIRFYCFSQVAGKGVLSISTAVF